MKKYQAISFSSLVIISMFLFQSCDDPPSVETEAVDDSEVTKTTAIVRGTVLDNGGDAVFERGICYGTVVNPTVRKSASEAGNGDFEVTLTGLSPDTKYFVRAYAENGAGPSYGNNEDFRTEKEDVPPVIETNPITDISTTTATSGGNITDDGGASVTARGVCWSTSEDPTIANSKTSNGTGSGSFTSSLTGLTPGTRYHLRAYATNSAGTGYGQDVPFDTEATIPSVTSTEITHITSATARSGGNVTSNGGASVTERGVCWSTAANPTTADSKTSDGAGVGSFTSSITGLTPGTSYHVRAFAKNSVGTAYGEDMVFKAGTDLATVTTTSATDITSTTATSGGNVTSDGGLEVTARGVCWSTAANPSTADSKTSDGTGLGTFTSSISGLIPGTSYHVRAYAKNSLGTAYGEDIVFIAGTNLASVTTTSATDITSTTASSGGNVTYDGGAAVTARGVCWSKYLNPTTVDSKTNDGGGTGSFSSDLTSLEPNTTYYVRAYATNISGTAYGGQVDFTTDPATVNDSDGNSYEIIRIGTQLWIKENLRTTRYRNGDPIANVTDNTEWSNLSTGAYSWYENWYSSYNSFGALYNWYAVNDARNLCPDGWHVPTQNDWIVLVDYLGGQTVAGGKLKEEGTTNWANPNTGATNETGFTAFGSGLRGYEGDFRSIRTFGGWWSSTSMSTNNGWRPGIVNDRIVVYYDLNDKRGGLSVRCVKDQK